MELGYKIGMVVCHQIHPMALMDFIYLNCKLVESFKIPFLFYKPQLNILINIIFPLKTFEHDHNLEYCNYQISIL